MAPRERIEIPQSGWAASAARGHGLSGRDGASQLSKTSDNKSPFKSPLLDSQLVIVQTGFDFKYQQRRKHARETWFPASKQELDR